jgi:DNA-binding transcriptional LysR family regulator
MDLRQLRQLVVLSEAGSFHRAAELLHIAQPPLSVSIRKLEQELGCELFVRHSKGVTPTPACEAVLVEARSALAHADRVRGVARAAAQGLSGSLRIGFVGSAVYTLLPRLVPAFRRSYEAVDLVFTESTSTEILGGLDQRTLDVGLIRYPVLTTARRELLPLEQHPFVLAVPAGHALAKRQRVRLAALRDEPFIAHSAQSVPNLHAIFLMLCQEAGFVPVIAQEAIQVQTLLTLVESGLGIALVPASAARYAGSRVRFIPLGQREQRIETGIALVQQEDSNGPLVRHFTRIARELAARR